MQKCCSHITALLFLAHPLWTKCVTQTVFKGKHVKYFEVNLEMHQESDLDKLIDSVLYWKMLIDGRKNGVWLWAMSRKQTLSAKHLGSICTQHLTVTSKRPRYILKHTSTYDINLVLQSWQIHIYHRRKRRSQLKIPIWCVTRQDICRRESNSLLCGIDEILSSTHI